MAGGVTPVDAFHLDDPGTHIGQEGGAVRAGKGTAEVDHGDSAEWFEHCVVLSMKGSKRLDGSTRAPTRRAA
ncbi:hypothetical protein D3C73_1317340 [compost metagenome]